MTDRYRINDVSELEKPLIVAGIAWQEGFEKIEGWYRGERIPGWYGIKVNREDYIEIPNTTVGIGPNKKSVWIRKSVKDLEG